MARSLGAIKATGRMVPFIGWGLAAWSAYDLWRSLEGGGRMQGVPEGWTLHSDCGVSGAFVLAQINSCNTAQGISTSGLASAFVRKGHSSGGVHYRSEWRWTPSVQAGSRILRQANIYRWTRPGTPPNYPHTWHSVPLVMPPVNLPNMPPEMYPPGQGSPNPNAPPVGKSPHSQGGQPSSRPSPRRRPQPRRRNNKNKSKEQKLKFNRGMKFILGILNGATEAKDLMVALFDALPEKVKDRYDVKDGKPITDVQKAKALWENFDKVEWDDAIYNIVRENIEDLVWAKLGVPTKDLGRMQGSNMGVNRLLNEAFGDAWADKIGDAGEWVTRKLNEEFGWDLRG